MKKFIASIIGKYRTRSTEVSPTVVPTPPIPEHLFVNHQAPSEPLEPEVVNKTVLKPLDIFLEQRFDAMGFQDGYEYHDADIMEKRLLDIGANFRMAVDRTIIEHKEFLHGLRVHMDEAEGLSPRMDAKLRREISYFEQIVDDLATQKQLSVEGEGLIAHSVSQYRFGFVRGIEQYRQQKLLMGNVHAVMFAKT